MKKTFLTVLLIAILVGGLFILTGCGDNKSNNNNSTPAKDTNQTQIEATEFYIRNLVPDTTIKSLSAAVSGTNSWTPNLLGDLELVTGTQAKIGLGITESTLNWDFKVTDEEGTEATFSSVNLSNILSHKSESVTLEFDEDNNPVAIVK